MKILSLVSQSWRERPRTVVVLWLFVAALLGVSGLLLGMRTVLPGPSSPDSLFQNPGERIAFASGLPPKDSLLAIVSHPTLPVDAPEFVKAREALLDKLRRQNLPGKEERLFGSVETAGHALLDDSTFISKDKHHLLFIADTVSSIDRSAEELEEVPGLLHSWQAEHPEFRIAYLSEGTADNEMFELIHRDLDHSLLYTLPITLIILVWAFRSVAAALLPLGMAIVSLIASLGASALLSHILGPVSATASQLVVLLVLAIGVDYSLFILSRMREEVRNGADYPTAIATARKNTGTAVFWSGLTVALSLFGLLLMADSVLRSMAVVSILAVIITVIGSLGVLPSVLLILGDRVELGRVRKLPPDSNSTIFKTGLKFSLRHPLLVLLCGGGLIFALSLFCFKLRLGNTIDSELMPKSMQSTNAAGMIDQQFEDLSGTDFSIILQGKALAGLDGDDAVQPFIDALHEYDTVRGPIDVAHSADRQVSRYEFLALGNSNDQVNREIISSIRSKFFPKYLDPIGVQGYTSGTLPYVVDDATRYRARTPIVFAAVLCLSFVFLLLAFRSIVVPLNAIVLNVLSTGASFGVLVLCFQLLPSSPWHYGVIEGFVPALLFSILFGLSMDYHVFLLSRVSEEVRLGATTIEAVERGIDETSSAITSAALIMVSVFAIIAGLELPVMKQLGVGLAVAVFLDATIIRSLLLPASMVILGKWNWYFPRSLSFLPQIRIE